MKSKQARLKAKRKTQRRIRAKKNAYQVSTVNSILKTLYGPQVLRDVSLRDWSLASLLKGDFMTVTCPDCGQELKVPMARRTRSGHSEEKPIGNEASVLAGHRGKMPCEARRNANAATARGLVRVNTEEGEVYVPLQEAGLVEDLRTRYDSGGPQPGSRRFRAASSIETEAWAPVWAVQVARDALAAGDEPSEALTTYWVAVREMPEDQVARSMLGDSRLLGEKEDEIISPYTSADELDEDHFILDDDED